MSVIFDNNFSKDSNATRTARLLTIQQNLASIQPELNAPAHIVTWAATCYDAYLNLTAQAGLEADQVEGATAVLLEKEALLDDEYQNVKFIGTTIYKDLPDYLNDYGFDLPYPTRRNDKDARIKQVLLAYQSHVAQTVTPLLPTSLMDRLQAAFEEFQDACGVQFIEMSESKHAYTLAQNRFIADTKMLNELKGWWYAMMGKKDGRIIQIGMVNPDYSGNTGQVPAVPTNLVFNYSSKVLWWDLVPTATSYQLQWFDGTDFIEIYSGSDDHFAYTPADGLNKFKVRARNNNGYSEFSSVLEQYYFEVLPKAANLQVVQSGTIPTEGELTWNAVPTAVSYKVYQSVDNIGEYAAHWLVIGTVTEPLKSVTLTLGKRNSFRVETNNTYQTSMSDEIFIEV